MSKIYTILLLLISFNLYSGELFNDTLPIAGKVYHNWYYGYSTGITFMTPDEEPEYLEYGGLDFFIISTTTLSDRYGNFILQSDGQYIINNDFEKIDSVSTRETVFKGAILIPLKNDKILLISNLYRQWHGTSKTTADLVYSIFTYDKATKSIFFEKKAEFLEEEIYADGIGATYNPVTNKYTVMTYDVRGTNYIYEFDLDGTLLRTNKQKTFATDERGLGEVKFNKMGDKVVYCNNRYFGSGNISGEDISIINIANFDPIELEMTNFRKIEIDSVTITRIEFSNNSNYIYFFGVDQYYQIEPTEEFYKYDLRKSKLTKISEGYSPKSLDYWNSMVGRVTVAAPSGLVIGPNNKIYNSRSNANHISVLKTPDDNSPNYVLKDIMFPRITDDKAFSYGSLPNLISGSFVDIYVRCEITICEGDSLKLFARTQLPDSTAKYEWTGPNNYSSDEQYPIIENSVSDMSGVYKLSVRTDTDVYFAETIVNIKESPKPEIKAYPSTFMCEDGEITLSILDDFESYLWTTGDTTKLIKVDESGTYGITVSNELGCESYVEVNVGFGNDYELQISGETEKCEGEEVTLTSTEEFEKYLWSNGDTTQSTTVTEAKSYRLTVETKEGCSLSKEVKVSNHPKVLAELMPTAETICSGDFTLLESRYTQDYFSYIWSINETTSSIYAKESGIYKLTITDTRTGCSDSTEIEIKVEDNLTPIITGKDICDGGSVTLTAIPNDPSYTYLWSTDETTPEILIDEPGIYTVTVSKDGCIGTAEFTVKESPNPIFSIIGEDILCGNPATLTCSDDFEDYYWSTDEISKSIEITESGKYTLTVTDENDCESTEEYIVSKSVLSFDLNTNSFNYGKLYLSDVPNDSLELTNTSGANITIEYNNQSYTLTDNESYTINNIISTDKVGSIDKTITIRITSPCDSVITVPVSAEVYTKLTLSVEDVETEIGETATIKVYTESETNLNLEDINFSLRLDEVFYTEESPDFVISSPIEAGKNSIFEISGMILLSDRLEYDLDLIPVDFNNQYIELDIDTGLMKIDSIYAFDFRKIEFTEPNELKLSPNPAKDKINVVINTEINSNVVIELISSEGKLSYSNEWIQSNKEQGITIPTDDIPSGLYQVRLHTNGKVITQEVVVVR